MNTPEFLEFADEQGYFGEFGGAFVPELLYPNIQELQTRYRTIIGSDDFQREFMDLITHYVGRPSPLYFAERLSQEVGFRVFLKREDLNHTGSHKINNVIGQVLLAKRLEKKRIIAETGAGQHGVATATVCARFGLPCTVFMGAIDVARQAPNVAKMKMLGAEVIAVESGSKVLKDATNDAMREWISNPYDTHYIIGSAIGPHPYPSMVAYFQSIISKEILSEFQSRLGKELPDAIIACVGGGSNSIGGFYHFINHPSVELIGVEAAGKGVCSGQSAATITLGKIGVFHGTKTLVMQSADGQIEEAHSISAGLDYPGIGPQHAFLNASGRVKYVSVTDDEAIEGVFALVRLEGIIPALESAHAIAALRKVQFSSEKSIVLILSGDGEKDMATYLAYRTQRGMK